MRAVLYCRVSTVEQTQNLSLDTQEAACRAYCAKSGYEVDRVFVDAGESAKTTDRPAFLDLLTYCRTHKGRVHAVVVYSLTRFARSSADHHKIATHLRGLGVSLRSVTEPIDDSSSGRLMEGILAAMAQFDNDVRSERTVMGMRAAVARGRWVWAPPIGYRPGARHGRGPSLDEDPVSAPLVRRAFTLVADGALAGTALRAHLIGLGLRGRKGQPLTSGRLYAMLRNPVYMGRFRATGWGAAVDADFPGLVSPELFTRAQVRLSARATAIQDAQHYVRHPDFPLRRFVRCGACRKGLTGSWSRGKKGKRYAFYHCVKGCTRLPTADLDTAFLDLLDRLAPAPGYLRTLRAFILDAWRTERDAHALDHRTRQRHIASLKSQLTKLDQAFIFDRTIDEATYVAHRDPLREQLVIADIAAGEVAFTETELEGHVAFAEHALTHASAIWTQARHVRERQRIQATFFPEGLTWHASRERANSEGSVGGWIEPCSCWEFFNLRRRDEDACSLVTLSDAGSNQIRSFLVHLQGLKSAA